MSARGRRNLQPTVLFLTTRVSSAGDCVTLTQVVTLEQQTVEVEDRVDCHPDPAATQERCEARGCVWRVSEPRLEGEEGPPWDGGSRRRQMMPSVVGGHVNGRGGNV